MCKINKIDICNKNVRCLQYAGMSEIMKDSASEPNYSEDEADVPRVRNNGGRAPSHQGSPIHPQPQREPQLHHQQQQQQLHHQQQQQQQHQQRVQQHPNSPMQQGGARSRNHSRDRSQSDSVPPSRPQQEQYHEQGPSGDFTKIVTGS